MTGLIGAIGRSFLVSSYIPALVFVALNGGLIASYLPPEISAALRLPSALDVQVVIAVIASAFLGYLLMILNPYIVKLYEGYYVLDRFECLRECQRERKRRLKKAAGLLKQDLDGQQGELAHRNWRVYLEQKAREIEEFPLYADSILPTRLGNVFRAFEDYPYQQYGIEAVFFWPLMTQVIPNDYAQRVEELNNYVAFCLASSLLSLLLFLEFVIICVSAPSTLWMVLTPTSLLMFYLLYRWAILASLGYGQYFRHCFDLFRLDLLKALGHKPVQDPLKEIELWRNVHKTLVIAEGSHFARYPR